MPASLRLDFDPARDGFAFANHFLWTPDDTRTLGRSLRLPTATALGATAALGALGAGPVGVLAAAALGAGASWAGLGERVVAGIARRWPAFGLCGGMALTAVERWSTRGGTPTSALDERFVRTLLRRKQEVTLRASLGTFARHWATALASRDPDGPFAADLERELDALETRLRAGRPAVLGLVGDAPDPFALHQVVAFGLDRRGPLDATITVYDPNAPGRTHAVTTAASLTPGRTRLSTTMPTGRRASGSCHVSRLAGHLAHVFVVPV